MATFELYRFQLLPASQAQQQLFGTSLSVDEIKAKKNELFGEVLSRLFPFSEPDLLQKVILRGGDWLVAMQAPKRKAILNTPDFRSELVEDWPHVTLFLNNDPTVQVVGVSRNQRAYKNSYSVIKMLEARLMKPLRDVGLTIQIHSIYDQKEFWSLIENNRGRVEKVRFEMIAPNMANISRVLEVDLRRLNQEANAQKTTLELEAVAGTALEIDKKDKLISSCVSYSADGGGDIKVKLRGVKAVVKTSTSIRLVEVEEAEFENTTPEDLNLFLKGMIE